MKSNIEVTKKVILELTEKEADWLKGLMQNPLGGHYQETEPLEEREMRTSFWNALGDDPIGDNKSLVVCKGSWALGTACGKCKRCADTKPRPRQL